MAKDKKKENPVQETPAQAENTVQEQPVQETPEQKEQESANAENKAEQQLSELQKKLDDANDKLLRTAAEYDNFRRRSQKEKEAIYSDSKSEIVGKLLPVIDNFERSAASQGDFESYKKGIEMTVKQLFDVMSALGVEAFGEAGDSFDPNIHNGVMHIEDENLPENTVAEVFVKGYKLSDRVVRHATVKVAN